MKTRFASLAVLATSVAVSFAVTAAAGPGEPGAAKPMFTTIPYNAPGHTAPIGQPPANLAQWSGGFTDHGGHSIHFVMVGTDPSTNNAPTTITTVIIPVIMTYGATNGNMTFNPKRDLYPNGQKVIKNMLQSPVFTSAVDFTSGGQDMGSTQYVDAFQRGNFWGANVQTNTNYHVLLSSAPTVLKPLKITVTSTQGKVIVNPFGTIKVGTMNINSFDSALQGYLRAHTADIHPDVLPIFVSDNIYLTSGGCCIGGYHSANGGPPGGQTYSYTTLVTEDGSFSEDVSALTHEISEWLDDPFTNNHVNCNDNSILEVGDPLVSGLPNYGNFVYHSNNFDYHLQDEVYIGYFGAPTSTSVNNQLDFQGAWHSVCPGQ